MAAALIYQGQLYESVMMYGLERSGWGYELQALRGHPSDGPSLLVFIPDDNPAAGTVTWEGSVRSMPLAILRRFLDGLDEAESPTSAPFSGPSDP